VRSRRDRRHGERIGRRGNRRLPSGGKRPHCIDLAKQASEWMDEESRKALSKNYNARKKGERRVSDQGYLVIRYLN
jgi:hypothetical protein